MKMRKFISLLSVILLICTTMLMSGCIKSEAEQKKTAQNFINLMSKSEKEFLNMNTVAGQSLHRYIDGTYTLVDVYQNFKATEHTYGGLKAQIEKFDTKDMPDDTKTQMDRAKKMYMEAFDEEIQGIQIYEEMINADKLTPKQMTESKEHFEKRRMDKELVREDIKSLAEKYDIDVPEEWKDGKKL